MLQIAISLGITQDFLGGFSTNFIVGMLTFSSGLNIDLDSFKKILKRQGLIMLLKLGIAVGLSLLYVELFGQSGILGISALRLLWLLHLCTRHYIFH